MRSMFDARCPAVLALLAMATASLPALAGDTADSIRVLAEPEWPAPGPKGTFRSVLCVSGYKFFQTIIHPDDKSAGTAVSTAQIFEKRAGKSLPARCE